MKFAKLVLILLSLLLTSTACSVRQTFPTLVPTPTITPVPTAPPTDEFCPPPQNWISYITQPGDSIASLARRTSTTVQALELANCLNNPRGALLARQVFYLPRQPLPP